MPSSVPAKIVLERKIISLDGKACWILTGNFADYFLNAVFLRFLFASILIYMLVEEGTAKYYPTMWQLAIVWLIATGTIIAALWVMFGIMNFLLARNYISALYTPLVLGPTACLTELTTRIALMQFVNDPWDGGIATSMSNILQDFAVMCLFDMLHTHYVAPLHPRGSGTSPLAAPRIAPAADAHESAPDDTGEDTGGPDAPPALAAPVRTIRIGNTDYALEDLVVLRTEEHYLHIVTRTGKAMQRAKLSALADLHASGLGMQISRSVWIARTAVASVTDGGQGSLTVTLTNGDQERVAKLRAFAFRQFLRTSPQGDTPADL